jgi:hypothetical protein
MNSIPPQHIKVQQYGEQSPYQHQIPNPFDFNHYPIPDSPGFPGMNMSPGGPSHPGSPHQGFGLGGLVGGAAVPVDIQQQHQRYNSQQQQQFDNSQAPHSPYLGNSFGGSQYSHSSSVPIHTMQNMGRHPSQQQAQQATFTAGSLGGSFHAEPSSYTEEVNFRDPAMVGAGVEGVDKRRKRRESHNAVERRRRDNINDKIQV